MERKKISKPIRPENNDCCGGGGCCPCVWDVYFDQLDLFEEQQEKEKTLAGTKVATTDESYND